MKRAHRAKMLRGVSLFDTCTDAELASIGALTTAVDIPAGEVLCQEGRPGRQCFVITEGEATVTIAGDLIANLGPGAFFGEMALLDHEPRVATVTAATPMRLLALSPNELASMLEAAPGVTRRMLAVQDSRLRQTEQA